MIDVLEPKINNKISLELVKYVYSRFPEIRDNMSFTDTFKFIDIFPDRIIVESENDAIKGFAMFMKLTDDSLIDVMNNGINYFQDLKKLMSENGEHIHFIGVVADGFKFIRKGIKKIREIYNPITISWKYDLGDKDRNFIMVLRE